MVATARPSGPAGPSGPQGSKGPRIPNAPNLPHAANAPYGSAAQVNVGEARRGRKVEVNPAAHSPEHEKGKAARERQRHRHEPAGSKMPLIVGGVVGAIFLIAVVVYLLMGEPAAPATDGGQKAAPATPAAPSMQPRTPAPEATPAPEPAP